MRTWRLQRTSGAILSFTAASPALQQDIVARGTAEYYGAGKFFIRKYLLILEPSFM